MHISTGILLFLLVASTIAACMAIERIKRGKLKTQNEEEEAVYWFLTQDWSWKPY